MSKEQYLCLLDAIECIHRENIVIMDALIRLHLDKEQTDNILKNSSYLWEKDFDEFRKYWEKV